ncbi:MULTISPECIES: 3'-5' exonuclease [unclassified Pseudoalteromonas]|uniref:3'-5' exonuclease n=1 Tax=unclassified Pseudoalteromonas TaxID=194690 RepID=UPI0004255C92|nr:MULTISPECIES: 3'-5' exonuclease [unclassified Pseudoalteromonas]
MNTELNDVMLDLETIGQHSNAVIVSIGAVFFNPITGNIGAEFYQVIDIEDAMKYGTVDGATLKWWMKKSDEARAIFNDKDTMPLKDALLELNDWLYQIEGYKNRIIWGNGATFDNVILSNAYTATKMTKAWHFSNDRDVRTVVDIGRRLLGIDPKKSNKFTGKPHNALDDAKHQAKYVSDVFKQLKLVTYAQI